MTEKIYTKMKMDSKRKRQNDTTHTHDVKKQRKEDKNQAKKSYITKITIENDEMKTLIHTLYSKIQQLEVEKENILKYYINKNLKKKK